MIINMNNISVIIPAYNNEKTIEYVLKSLLDQNIDKTNLEIIVIDDASQDDTFIKCANFGINSIKNEINIGLAASLNKGIIMSKNDIIVTLHADTIPLTKTWLDKLVNPLQNLDVAACCSLQSSPLSNGSDHFLSEILLYGGVKDHNALNNKADSYKKDVLLKIGLFDEKRYQTAGEDEDLALRLRLSGFKVIGTDAKVIHKHFFNVNSNFGCYQKILKKEYDFGQAGGVLRRKFPFHKFGNYLFPEVLPFFYDGFFRSFIIYSLLIPYVNLLSLSILILFSFKNINNMYKKFPKFKYLLLYPLFNISRWVIYSMGFLIGLIKGQQY